MIINIETTNLTLKWVTNYDRLLTYILLKEDRFDDEHVMQD